MTMQQWILAPSQFTQHLSPEFHHEVSANGLSLCTKGLQLCRTKQGVFVYTGYIIPRQQTQLEYTDTNDLIFKLWDRFGEDWKFHVKGVFSWVGFMNEKWLVVNDQLSLSKIYWNEAQLIYSSSYDSVCVLSQEKSFNYSAFWSRKYFHRDIGEITLFNEINKTRAGVQFQFLNGSWSKDYYFNYLNLLSQPVDSQLIPEHFIPIWEKVLLSMNRLNPQSKHLITLTGGKDARTGLAILKHFNQTADGFTYGVPGSKDAVFAKKLSSQAGVRHEIPELPCDSALWEEEITRCLEADASFISPHRALRNSAFRKMSIDHKGAWYWGGYMGGEWLMGLYADGLVFPKWLTDFKKGDSLKENVLGGQENLSHCTDLVEEIERMQEDIGLIKNQKELQLVWMFEIGVIHHGQDIHLARENGLQPYPFLMDIDFIEQLFQSRFSFIFQNHDSKNLLQRWKLYEWNITIQNALMPQWSNIPFGKKGEYTPRIFSKGPWIWSLCKGLHYLFESKKYPSSYTYSEDWRKAYLNWLKDYELNDLPFYTKEDGQKLFEALSKSELAPTEKGWMEYSRWAMVYLQNKKMLKLSNANPICHIKK